jgi:hypothetical protein
MKKILLVSIVLIALTGMSCNTQTGQKPATEIAQNGSVEVYYFHMTTRCATCRTIEAEARKNVEMLYPDKSKNGEISFIALNIEEATGKSVGERLGVNSQTLLIVKGDQKINITNEGFLYAVSQPQKFSEVMKLKIDPLMK